MSKPWLKYYDEGVPESIEYPKICIFELLDRSSEKFPKNTLSIFFGKNITYYQMKNLSDAFAHSLANLGVRPEDKVVLLLPNFPGYLIAYYGILKAGAVVVPLNPLYTESELEHLLSDSEAVGIITIPMFADKAASLAKSLNLKFVIVSYLSDFLPVHLKFFMRFKEKRMVAKAASHGVDLINMAKLIRHGAAAFKPFKKDPDGLGVIIYSGGTTGVAKGIMLSHSAVVANAYQIAAWGQLTEEDRILAVLPLFHGYGMNVCMNAPVLAGMSIVLLPKFDPKQMVKAIHKYRPTTTAVVPTILTALSNLPNVEKYDFTSLKAVWVGAAPLTEATKEQFEARAKCKVIEGYGLTEAVTAIMANPYKGVHKVGSIGIPFPDVDAKIVSLDDGRELSPGEQGELVIKSPTIMMGYYKKPELTAEVVKDGWLYTGDIGYMDEDGYFYITDRKKDLIIVGGFNVFPSEIDEVLYRHPKVKEGVTVGIPDEYKGERIKVYVVLKDGVEATEEEFKEYFRQHLAPYKVPSEIEFRDSLPKNAIGKILRRVLREEEMRKIREKVHR